MQIREIFPTVAGFKFKLSDNFLNNFTNIYLDINTINIAYINDNAISLNKVIYI